MHLRRRYLIATAKTACSDTAAAWAAGLNIDARIGSLKCHLASSTKPPTLYFMSKCHSPYLDVSCLFSGQKAATSGGGRDTEPYFFPRHCPTAAELFDTASICMFALLTRSLLTFLFFLFFFCYLAELNGRESPAC